MYISSHWKSLRGESMWQDDALGKGCRHCMSSGKEAGTNQRDWKKKREEVGRLAGKIWGSITSLKVA